MKTISFGPVLNEDGTPSETTARMLGYNSAEDALSALIERNHEEALAMNTLKFTEAFVQYGYKEWEIPTPKGWEKMSSIEQETWASDKRQDLIAENYDVEPDGDWEWDSAQVEDGDDTILEID